MMRDRLFLALFFAIIFAGCGRGIYSTRMTHDVGLTALQPRGEEGARVIRIVVRRPGGSTVQISEKSLKNFLKKNHRFDVPYGQIVYPGDVVDVSWQIDSTYCSVAAWSPYDTSESSSFAPATIDDTNFNDYSISVQKVQIPVNFPAPGEVNIGSLTAWSGSSNIYTQGQGSPAPCTEQNGDGTGSIYVSATSTPAATASPTPTQAPSPSPTPSASPTPSPTPTLPTNFRQGCSSQSETAGTAIAAAVNANANVLNAPTGKGATPYGQELYGFIYQNDATSIYYYLPGNNGQPLALNATGTVSFSAAPFYQGYRFIGWYHTHPFDPNAQGGLQTDANNGLFFSPADLGPNAPGGTAYVAVMTATIDGGNITDQWFSDYLGKQSSGIPVGSGKCP